MIEIYAKKQRAKRRDPQQEAIVAEKDIINERTKKLIALMIAMKKGWNGGPSPDIGVEKFNLTQPIPDVVVGAGDSALNELSSIVQTLHKLKSMQDTYSIAHGQRSEALNKLKENAQTPPQQGVPVTSSLVESALKKVASNPFTRIWTHLTAYNPFASEKNRGYRLELLRSLARVDSSLEDIEDKILSQGESTVLDSVYVAKQLYSDAKSSFFGDFRKNIDKMISDVTSEIETLKTEIKNKPRQIEEDSYPPIINDEVKTPQNPNLLVAVNNIQNIIEEKPEEIQDEPNLLSDNVVIPGQNEVKNTEESVVESDKGVAESEQLEKERLAKERADKREAKAKEREAARALRKQKSSKKPNIQVVPTPPKQSDFVDSDFEQIQRDKYIKILEYVFKHVESLLHECLNIANSNIPKFWKVKIREEAQKARQLAIEIAKQISAHEDFDMDYGHFLELVGIIKAMSYVADSEIKAAESDPNFVSGSLFNIDDIKSQAVKFANEQFAIFMAMNQKISQANEATRFIKRMITHIIPRRDKNLRLTISRNVRNARKGLQKLLNVLEQRNVDFRKLMDVSQDFLESINYVYEGLADLGDMYNSTMRMEKSLRKQTNVKMTYDMIPTMDINSLRMAAKSITSDLFNIQKLEKLEEGLLELNNLGTK